MYQNVINTQEHIELIEQAISSCTNELERIEWNMRESGETESWKEQVKYFEIAIVALCKLKNDLIKGDAAALNIVGEGRG